jgi:hypothetical protein
MTIGENLFQFSLSASTVAGFDSQMRKEIMRIVVDECRFALT